MRPSTALLLATWLPPGPPLVETRHITLPASSFSCLLPATSATPSPCPTTPSSSFLLMIHATPSRACSPGNLRRRAPARSTSRRGDGRLMVVLKESKQATEGWRRRRTWSFKVRVLDGAQWKETYDISDAVLLVGVNESTSGTPRCWSWQMSRCVCPSGCTRGYGSTAFALRADKHGRSRLACF